MRPHYHFAPASNWLSDPNGLIWHDGRWHMFYQYNPHGEQWGHMAWGHAVSHDLARWHECAPALLEDDAHMIFSGSAVIDHGDCAGFGAGAMVAIYTGAAHAPTRHQSQCLAYSHDGGETWRKHGGNPVLDRQMADFRDPNVFWHEPSAQWIMVVALSEDDSALIYGSNDLVAWSELSSIPTHGAPGHLWECPTLIELPVEGGDASRWLFKVDVLGGATGSGAIALIGDFDGVHFIPETDSDGIVHWISVDDGRDFYAAIPWHEPRDAAGRPCWIGWMGNHAYQASLPERGWRGAMSLPRTVSLRQSGNGWRIVQQVVPAVAALFAAGKGTRIASGHRTISIAIASTIDLDGAGDWSIDLRDGDGHCLTLRRDGHDLTIVRDGGIHPSFDAPVQVRGVGQGPLRIWLDAATIEIELDNGARWIGLQHLLMSDAVEFSLAGSQSISVSLASLHDGAIAR